MSADRHAEHAGNAIDRDDPRGNPSPTGLSLGIGLGSGLLAGIFGVGGGVVLVPALTVLLKLTQHRAHATSLAAIILTATAGAIGFALQGSVAFGAAAYISVGAIAGAFIGAHVMRSTSPRRLKLFFGALLVLVAIQLLSGVGPSGDEAGNLPPFAPVWFVIAGMLIGVLSSVMGVGGGAVLVPVLVLGFGFSQQIAEGTSLAVIIPTALTGSLRHARHGYTDWRIGTLVGLGGAAGALAGSLIAHGLDALLLQRLFGVLLLIVGARMLITTARQQQRPAEAT